MGCIPNCMDQLRKGRPNEETGRNESQGRRGVSIDRGSGLGGSGELSHLGVIPAEFPVLSLSRQLLKTFRLSLTTLQRLKC